MATMLEELRKHLAETPKEQLDKEWEEIKELTKDIDSPNALDYCEEIRGNLLTTKEILYLTIYGLNYMLLKDNPYDLGTTAYNAYEQIPTMIFLINDEIKKLETI